VTTFELAYHKFGLNKERLMRARILAKTVYNIILPAYQDCCFSVVIMAEIG